LYIVFVLYSFIVQVDRTQRILRVHTSSFAYIAEIWITTAFSQPFDCFSRVFCMLFAWIKIV